MIDRFLLNKVEEFWKEIYYSPYTLAKQFALVSLVASLFMVWSSPDHFLWCLWASISFTTLAAISRYEKENNKGRWNSAKDRRAYLRYLAMLAVIFLTVSRYTDMMHGDNIKDDNILVLFMLMETVSEYLLAINWKKPNSYFHNTVSGKVGL
jgi:hypothetical protein